MIRKINIFFAFFILGLTGGYGLTSTAYAQTAGNGEKYKGPVQNQIGDVISQIPAGSATGSGTFLDSISSIQDSGAGLFLNGGSSMLGTLTDFDSSDWSLSLDDLFPVIQSLILSALFSAIDMDGFDMSSVMGNAMDLQNGLNMMQNSGCATDAGSAVYAQNAFIQAASSMFISQASSGPLNLSGMAQDACSELSGSTPGTPGEPGSSKYFDPNVLDPGNEYKSKDAGPCDSQLKSSVSAVHGEYFGDRFAELPYYTRQAAIELGVDPSELMGIMMIESGGLPYRDNGLGYMGLIQFGDAAAADMGTTNEHLASLPIKDQMPYVIEYLRQHGVEPGMTGEQIYAAIHGGNPGALYGRDCANGHRTIDIYNNRVKPYRDSFAQQFDWNNLECVEHSDGAFQGTPMPPVPAGYPKGCG